MTNDSVNLHFLLDDRLLLGIGEVASVFRRLLEEELLLFFLLGNQSVEILDEFHPPLGHVVDGAHSSKSIRAREE